MSFLLAMTLISVTVIAAIVVWKRNSEPTIRVPYAIHEVVVAGSTHATLQGGVLRSTIYSDLCPGQRLRLVRQPDCAYDSNAVLVYTEDGPMSSLDLGYIPKRFAAEVSTHMDNDKWPVLAEVKAIERYGKYKSLRIHVYLPDQNQKEE